jgi:hypothetical protein
MSAAEQAAGVSVLCLHQHRSCGKKESILVIKVLRHKSNVYPNEELEDLSNGRDC